MMPRMSSSRMIRKVSPSILISVPPYFEMRTLSPFFTVKSTFLPSSFTLPVPRATTLPSCGFSFAVSGMMIPPFFVSRSEEHTSELQSQSNLVCRLLLEKKKNKKELKVAKLVSTAVNITCYRSLTLHAPPLPGFVRPPYGLHRHLFFNLFYS